MSEFAKLVIFLVIAGIISLLSWLARKKKEEEMEAEARGEDEFPGEEREPVGPQAPAATGLEAFLEQLAGKTTRPQEPPKREEPAPPRVEEREEPRRAFERPPAARREAPAPSRAAREEPRRAPVREIARTAARSVERAGVEAQRGPSSFERRRKEAEERIAAAKKEAEEVGEHALAAREDITLAAATVAGPETPGLPAAVLAGGELDRENLRRAIVMMEVLSRPRALRGYEPLS